MRREMKVSLMFCLVAGLTFHSCSRTESSIDKIVEDYYKTFNKRQDFEKFLSFYDEEIILEDIVNGDRIIGKKELGNFFDWNNTNFKSLDKNSLVIERTIIENNISVVKGYFSKFQWGDFKFEPMHFTTILTFNESKKIVKQVDWINYPSSLVNYNERKNSNEWIE